MIQNAFVNVPSEEEWGQNRNPDNATAINDLPVPILVHTDMDNRMNR